MASGAKKSLFSKPAFSKSASGKVQSGASATDLFSRADSSYSAIIEEEEKRIEKRKIKAARRAEEASKGNDTADGARKRRCISISDPSSEEESDHDKPERNKSHSPLRNSVQAKHASKTDSSKLISTIPTTHPDHEVLELSDDDAGSQIAHHIGRHQANGKDQDLTFSSSNSHVRHLKIIGPPKIDPGEDEEDEVELDDEFAELARQARETARKKQAELAIHSFQADPSLGSQNDHPLNSLKVQAINIHVESPIPGVERKTLKRRLDQRLRQVRLTWCDANGFSDEESKSIILMFRGKRVFDVNTPETLGISVDAQGETHVHGDDPLNPLEPSGDIVMEAIREDEEKAYMLDWLKRYGRAPAENDEERMAEAQMAQPEPVQESVKIICRAKNFPDFKIAVKKSTTIGRIQEAFTISNQLTRDIEVFVIFDGERPAPEVTVGDLDIEDMDILDVQVKHP